VEGIEAGLPFFTEAVRDFSDQRVREAFARGIETAPVPRVEVSATAADASAAVEAAAGGWAGWRDRAVMERAAMLIGTADEMRRRRDELCGIIIRESGKNWTEADADVCEAIDFCRFYAREAVGFCRPSRIGKLAGERNEHWHVGRGVAAVISPWNFPLSICTGMTSAALVSGNTVVLKPAEQTAGTAKVLCEMMWKAGVPGDALRFLPGVGEVVGAQLVRDPRVALIAFTGSAAVGFDVIEAAGKTPANQGFVKHVVCEMGGKNAIIVDETADLDEAVLGVRQSAFSYAGQKCSACSRVIVLEGIYEAFVRRLVESTASLRVGDAMLPGTDVGPLIDGAAAKKVREHIAIGRSEGKVQLAMDVPEGLEERTGRPFVGPHIFSGIEARHRLANEEIFGPVLAVMKAASFEEAVGMATGVKYCLTGGVFSRRPSRIAMARREFLVGNLYVNRGITGALVGRQPFGGFGWSGLGTQAGGREYLLQFMVPRSYTENAIRRGFAPDDE
jgi:RHH-type proline utilization regulon transcriptional repressor/proline dehydrogenase/delta 1-pyrroline-5-carboxylate dehydrogenase